LGGLISHYGALEHQDVFSKAGIFSPSYWWSDSVWTFVQETGKQEAMRMYQMTGSLEGPSMVSNTLLMHDSLLSVGFFENEISTIIIPGGEHNELLWRTQFEEAYLWLFADYVATDIEEIQAFNILDVYPNPAHNQLKISNVSNIDEVSLKILDVLGKVVLEIQDYQGMQINIEALNTGSYIIQIQSESVNYIGKFIKT